MIRAGGASTVIRRLDAGEIWLPAISVTAPPDMDRVGASPAVPLWVASRVAVMVRPDVPLVATSSRATLPFRPTTRTPE